MRKLLLNLSIVIVCVAFAIVFIGQSVSSFATQILGDNWASVPATYDPAQYGLPERIGGYKVLAVLTSDNTACMMPGEKRLILQADHSKVDDYLKNSNPEAIKKDLKQSGLGEMSKWGFQIAGPGANLDRALLELQSWNEQAREFGCRRARPAGDRTVSKKIMLASMLTIGTDWTEIKKPSLFFGYAEFEDTDAGTFTDDNAQSVFLIAPASIGNRREVVAFGGAPPKLYQFKASTSRRYQDENLAPA